MPREKKFKKDSYWKPLLRLFRRYMKKGALYKGAYRKIRSRPVEEHSRLFMIALELPKSIKRTKETEFAVLLLINSHSLTHRNKLTAQSCKLMGDKAQELRQRYFQFFVDNNTSERVTFYRDPLI